MHKAYVGFSSPVAYDYANPARKCLSDNSSSPNPVLVGVTGLLLLFDEIWFPCRSVCPNSMRDLKYVKFVSEEIEGFTVDLNLAAEITRGLSSDVNLDSIHPEGFSVFAEKYYGLKGTLDNHTHTISCLGADFSCKPDFDNLVLDLLVMERLGGGFTHALNGLTRKMTFPNGLDWLRNNSEDVAIRLADRALTISSIYDLTGPDGPYHPVMEELREHAYIGSFRKWVRNEASTLHNNSAAQVFSDLNSITRDFERSALRSAIGSGGLKDTTISLVEGMALDLLPGSSSVKTIFDMIGQKRNAGQRMSSAFIAESRGAIWQAHNEAKGHFY